MMIRYTVGCWLLFAATSGSAWADDFSASLEGERLALLDDDVVVVFGDTESRTVRDAVEGAFVQEISNETTLMAMAWRDLFPEPGELDDAAIAERLAIAQVKAVLRISLDSSEEITKPVAKSSGVYKKKVGVADTFSLVLEAAKDRARAWVALGAYEEDSHRDAAHDLAWDAVADLIENGVFPKLTSEKKRARKAAAAR